MKIKREAVLELAEKIEAQLLLKGLSYTDIAVRARIDPSQMNRICHGSFRTLNPSIVQICNILGILTDSSTIFPPRLLQALSLLWDGTPADEERLIKLFALLGQMICRDVQTEKHNL